MFFESETECQSEDEAANGNYCRIRLVSRVSCEIEGIIDGVAHIKTFVRKYVPAMIFPRDIVCQILRSTQNLVAKKGIEIQSIRRLKEGSTSKYGVLSNAESVNNLAKNDQLSLRRVCRKMQITFVPCALCALRVIHL